MVDEGSLHIIDESDVLRTLLDIQDSPSILKHSLMKKIDHDL